MQISHNNAVQMWITLWKSPVNVENRLFFNNSDYDDAEGLPFDTNLLPRT
jgi:hypothetical protein